MRHAPEWFTLVALLVTLAARPVAAFHVASEPVQSISAEQVKRLLDARERLILIDLRPGAGFGKGHLPGARSVPLSELPGRAAEVPRTGRVVLYCDCPAQETQAANQFLRDQGHRNIEVLEEGFPGWVKRGYPLER